MPYYKEYFNNRSANSSVLSKQNTGSGAKTVVGDALSILESAELMSFRTHPHKQALLSQELLELQADPYASFLENISRRNYHARLAERGLPEMGNPDNGHAFSLKRHTLMGRLDTWSKTANGWTDIHTNRAVYPVPSSSVLLNHVHNGGVLTPTSLQEDGLANFAQQAYSRTAPTSVMFDAATFLGELREGLPRIPTKVFDSFRDFAGSVGDGYLSAQFGLIPLLNDLKSAGAALAKATATLTQQGQRVHRKYSLPALERHDTVSYTGSVSSVGVQNGFVPVSTPGVMSVYSTSGTGMSAEATHTKTMRTQRWFEGEFSFFYPLGFNPNDYLARLDVLMNMDFSVRTLWELAPWSWMIDWFLNIEASIASNLLAANDHLIMHYGYAMETTVYTTGVSWKRTGSAPANTTGLPSSGKLVGRTEYKRRLRANPYGFQVNPTGSLTSSQLNILGALGLTKAR